MEQKARVRNYSSEPLAWSCFSLCLCVFVVNVSAQHTTELRRTSRVTREDGLKIRGTEMLAGNLAEHIVEVGRQRQVAAFV